MSLTDEELAEYGSILPEIRAAKDFGYLDQIATDLFAEVERQRVRIQDLEHELKLARQHLDVCDRWQAVCDDDRAKARSNR